MDTEMYRKMYALLCSAASEAIDELECLENREKAILILQQALWKAEEIYIENL